MKNHVKTTALPKNLICFVIGLVFSIKFCDGNENRRWLPATYNHQKVQDEVTQISHPSQHVTTHLPTYGSMNEVRY